LFDGEPGTLSNGAATGALFGQSVPAGAALAGSDEPSGQTPLFSPALLRPPVALDPATSGEVPRVETERDVVRVSVSDHGLGIPSRDLERIFERFYRVDHGRSRNTGGTGLGLSIVRHVANNHQGRVDVESREGEGSTFTLVLPMQQDRGA
jgi:hypothetical protein